MMTIKTVFIIFTVLCFSSITGHSLADSSKENSVDKIAQQVIQEFQIPGVAVAVIKDNSVLFAKGYGRADIETETKVDSHTIFKIASNSKAFTSAALAILVDQGKLNWHDKVVQYLPNFKLYNKEVTEAFNIIDLLTHRSGLRIGAGDLMIWPAPTKFTRQDVIKNLRYLKPVSEFRKAYAYDNLLYIVAGEVVAKISGMSWEDFVEKNIFSPLNMNQCFAGGVPVQHNTNSVAAHAVVDGNLQVLHKNKINDKTSIMAAAGGIKCSVADLSQWVKMLLNNQSKSSLVSTEQTAALWTPHTKLRLSNSMKEYDKSTFHSYALGWRASDYFGHRRISHTGMLAGSMSQIVLFPDLNLGFVILTNQQSGLGRNAIMRSLLQLYVEAEARPKVDWVNKYKRIKNKSIKKSSAVSKVDAVDKTKQRSILKKLDSQTLSARLGSYSDPWFGKIKLSLEEENVVFTSDMSPRLIGNVYWHSHDRWWVRWDDRSLEADAWIKFAKTSDGSSVQMTMKPISSKTDFSFDFEDLFFTQLKGLSDND